MPGSLDGVTGSEGNCTVLGSRPNTALTDTDIDYSPCISIYKSVLKDPDNVSQTDRVNL